MLLRERVAADRTYRGEQIDSLRRLLKRYQPGDIVACPPYGGPLGHLRTFFYNVQSGALHLVSRSCLFRAIDLDVLIMFYSAPLLGAIVLASRLVSASFYDNPEQDPIPEQGTPLDELTQKWSTDVSMPRHPDDCQKLLTRNSGDSAECRRSPTSSTSGA